MSLLILISCEDYLDKQPYDQISASTFWKTKEDFDMAVTSNYGLLQSPNAPWDNPMGGMWSFLYPNWDNLTDNSFGQHSYGNSKAIVMGDINPLTGGYISGAYISCYQGIVRSNIFLEKLDNYEGSDISEKDRKLYEAEIRFFRAFYYFQLYFLYGDVPLVTEPLTLENQEQPKVTADKIFEQIISDLDYAIANLNAVPYYNNSGHVVKSTAQAFKARALIYKAYDEEGNPDKNILSQVKQLCIEIMPLYSLSPAFENLFQNSGQRNNPEIIFSINFLAPDNVPPYGVDLLYGDWLVVSPLQNFINTFECIDGLPWGVSPLTDADNPFKNRDPRLNKTVFVNYVDWGNGKVHYPTNDRPTGYGLKKFLEPNNIPYGYATLSEQNVVLIRLAEVLLMYAEAQNELLDSPDESVYNALNNIRARVDMPPLPDGLSKELMREKIRHERRVELAFESGLRYYDLKRWRIAGEVLNNVTDGLLNYHWEDKFYHWPLPQEEIEKNHGTLVQNSDY